MTTRWIITYLLLLLTAPPLMGTAAAERPTPAFYAEINVCQRVYPAICIELFVSTNARGAGDVYLSYFVHSINYEVIYHQVNLFSGLTGMLTISHDARTARLVIPAGTISQNADGGEYGDNTYIVPGEIVIQWETGQDRYEIDTTVRSFLNGTRARIQYSSVHRPALAVGELLGFVVDSRVGPQYTGEDAARISVTTTRESQ